MMSAAEKQAKEVHRLAEESAAEVRNDAAADAARLFEKIEALERPLTEFVAALRTELDSLGREFASRGATLDYQPAEAGAGGEATDAQATDPEETDTEPTDTETQGPSAATRPSAAVTVETAEDSDRAEQTQPAVETQDEAPAADTRDEHPADAPAEGHDEQPVEATEQEPAAAAGAPVSDRYTPKPARTGLLRRRKLFISTPGQCAVCHTSFAAGSKDALNTSGWHVHGEQGLCPQCQSEGWLLPAGGGLPHRRGGRPH